jgi:hypothetical protein
MKQMNSFKLTGILVMEERLALMWDRLQDSWTFSNI